MALQRFLGELPSNRIVPERPPTRLSIYNVSTDRHSPQGYGRRRFAERRSRKENRLMEAKPIAVKETPEQAAESISAALDFLQGEAEAAGLSEVGELIQQASTKAKECRKPISSDAPTGPAMDLPDACKAIVGLPAEYRKALILKKVYRRSYEEIAGDCNVSVATAKDRVMKGFRLVRASLRANLA
jgi:DNA-directed RNA polymerase specialized sigma24 family protein